MTEGIVSESRARTPDALDARVKLSYLWIFISLNYIFCDVVSNMYAPDLKLLIEGAIGGIEVTQAFLLFAGISLEIPFAMVLMSRFLKGRANRWANIVAGTVMALYQLGSFFAGSGTTMHYVFFSVIEIACAASIVAIALRWKP